MTYNGKVQILEIVNEGCDNTLAVPKCITVHYPDAQQLILWLSDTVFQYTTCSLTNSHNTVIINTPVQQFTTGTILFLFDTLPLEPETYTLTIKHTSGLSHHIHFVKKDSEAEIATPEPTKPMSYLEKLYHDNLQHKQNPKPQHASVLFKNHGRSATFTYCEPGLTIDFISELGFGCLFYILIPTRQDWEKETGTPINRRHQIIEYLAQEAQRTQRTNLVYTIEESAIYFYEHTIPST